MNLDRTTCSDFKHSIGVPENIGAVPFDQKAFEMVQPSQWWPGQSRRSKVRLKRVSIMDSPCPNSYLPILFNSSRCPKFRTCRDMSCPSLLLVRWTRTPLTPLCRESQLVLEFVCYYVMLWWCTAHGHPWTLFKSSQLDIYFRIYFTPLTLILPFF